MELYNNRKFNIEKYLNEKITDEEFNFLKRYTSIIKKIEIGEMLNFCFIVNYEYLNKNNTIDKFLKDLGRFLPASIVAKKKRKDAGYNNEIIEFYYKPLLFDELSNKGVLKNNLSYSTKTDGKLIRIEETGVNFTKSAVNQFIKSNLSHLNYLKELEKKERKDVNFNKFLGCLY